MKVKTPKEPVYYYEAGNGRFRLTYFIPPEELERLNQGGHISDEALNDYPDGVDLDCTEPDFKRFEAFYGYRPAHDPEALLRAFFTVFSDTRKWETFRGTGMIRADVLEETLVQVEDTLEKEALVPEEIPPLEPQLPLDRRRHMMTQRGRQQQKMRSYLEEMSLDVVDSRQSMAKQEFRKIEMRDGEDAVDVFTKLHRK